MKVVEGKFGKEEAGEEAPTLLEAVTAAFEEIGVTEERKGLFFMCINTPERFTFVTNETNPAELLALIEASKHPLLAQYMEQM